MLVELSSVDFGGSPYNTLYFLVPIGNRFDSTGGPLFLFLFAFITMDDRTMQTRGAGAWEAWHLLSLPRHVSVKKSGTDLSTFLIYNPKQGPVF